MTDLVIFALVRKPAKLAGQIEHNQEQLRQLIVDLDNVDATIHLFNSTIELEAIKAWPVPEQHRAFRGEVTRIVLATLRKRQEAAHGRRNRSARHGRARARYD